MRAKRLLLSAQKLLTAFERTGKAIEWEGKRSLGYSQRTTVEHGGWEKADTVESCAFFALATVNTGGHVTLGTV